MVAKFDLDFEKKRFETLTFNLPIYILGDKIKFIIKNPDGKGLQLAQICFYKFEE